MTFYSWELDVYNYFLRNNIPIERNIPIKYTYNGKEKVTFIDFRVDNVLLEVKAQHLLEGCFDHKLEVPITKERTRLSQVLLTITKVLNIYK